MQINIYRTVITLGRTKITINFFLKMNCREVTHRYYRLRHIRSVDSPSPVPEPLSFFPQNGGSDSSLRLGEGRATK